MIFAKKKKILVWCDDPRRIGWFLSLQDVWLTTTAHIARSWSILDRGKLVSNTLLLLFFRISTLPHILHIRSSFGLVHSIIIFLKNILNIIKDHSTSSTNRKRGNRGNFKSRKWDPSRFRLCFLQPDLSSVESYRTSLFLRESARTLLNFHCLRVTISYQISWRLLPQSPSLGISRVHFQVESTRVHLQSHTLPQVTTR